MLLFYKDIVNIIGASLKNPFRGWHPAVQTPDLPQNTVIVANLENYDFIIQETVESVD